MDFISRCLKLHGSPDSGRQVEEGEFYGSSLRVHPRVPSDVIAGLAVGDDRDPGSFPAVASQIAEYRGRGPRPEAPRCDNLRLARPPFA